MYAGMPGVGSRDWSSVCGQRSVSTTLLDGLRACNSGAWNRLVDLFGPVIFRRAVGKGLQPSDADDIIQEVLLSVARNAQGFRRRKPSDTFTGWVWKITDNKITDHGRRQRGVPVAKGGTDAQEQIGQIAEADDDGVVEGGDCWTDMTLVDANSPLVYQAAEAVRNEFNLRAWSVFWGMKVQEESIDILAEELNMTPNAVLLATSRLTESFCAKLNCLLVRQALRTIGNDFGERTREIFWRIEVRGERAVDVAEDLKMKPAAVRRAKHRVKERFEEEWKAVSEQVRQIAAEGDDRNVGAATSGADYLDADCDLVHELLQAIRSDFSDTTWRIFCRREVQKKSIAEVARELNVTQNAVRQATCRVAKRLRDEWEELSG